MTLLPKIPATSRPASRQQPGLGRSGALLFLVSVLLGSSSGFSMAAGAAGADGFNGFDVSNAIVPVKQILSGGPPRDGIPSIDRPRFLPADDVRFLKEEDLVVSFRQGNEVRAYPLRILVWHEVVNDQIGDLPIAVTYCPLCGTAMVFQRSVNGMTLQFGVSGLLYQSDVLLYDRQTETLWSQLAAKGVAGKLANTVLEWLPSELMNWKGWREQYPEGRVLSTETGHQRDYSLDAYAEYAASPEPVFPVPQHRRDLPQKAWVIGVVVGREAKAYPLEALRSRPRITDFVGNIAIEVEFDSGTEHIRVKKSEFGQTVPSVKAYWFAWQAFYPDTKIWPR